MNKTATLMVFTDLVNVIGMDNKFVQVTNDLVYSGYLDGELIYQAIQCLMVQVGLRDLIGEIEYLYNEKLKIIGEVA